jgi:hypothetical protein
MGTKEDDMVHGFRQFPNAALMVAVFALGGCDDDPCALDGTAWLGPDPGCAPGADNSYGACSRDRMLFDACSMQLQHADTIQTFSYRVVGQVVEMTSYGTVPVSEATLGAGDTLMFRGKTYTLTGDDASGYWFGIPGER